LFFHVLLRFLRFVVLVSQRHHGDRRPPQPAETLGAVFHAAPQCRPAAAQEPAHLGDAADKQRGVHAASSLRLRSTIFVTYEAEHPRFLAMYS
jgi:hypothetical protein